MQQTAAATTSAAAALDCLASAASDATSSPTSSSAALSNLRGGNRYNRSSYNSKDTKNPPTLLHKKQHQPPHQRQHPHDLSITHDQTVVHLQVRHGQQQSQTPSQVPPQSEERPLGSESSFQGLSQPQPRPQLQPEHYLEVEDKDASNVAPLSTKSSDYCPSTTTTTANSTFSSSSLPTSSGSSLSPPSMYPRRRNTVLSDTETQQPVHAQQASTHNKNLLETTLTPPVTFSTACTDDMGTASSALTCSGSSSQSWFDATGKRGSTTRLENIDNTKSRHDAAATTVASTTEATGGGGSEDGQEEEKRSGRMGKQSPPPSPSFFSSAMPVRSAGLSRWQAWRRENLGHDPGLTDKIMPCMLLQFLESRPPIVSLSSPLDPHSATMNPEEPVRLWIDTFLKPILIQWDHEERQHWEQQQQVDKGLLLHQKRCLGSSNINNTTSSLQSAQHHHHHHRHSLSLPQSQGREQDHAQRLSQLEQSHRETTKVISQLQQKIRRLSSQQQQQHHPHPHPHQYNHHHEHHQQQQEQPQLLQQSPRSSEQPAQFDLDLIQAMERTDHDHASRKSPEKTLSHRPLHSGHQCAVDGKNTVDSEDKDKDDKDTDWHAHCTDTRDDVVSKGVAMAVTSVAELQLCRNRSDEPIVSASATTTMPSAPEQHGDRAGSGSPLSRPCLPLSNGRLESYHRHSNAERLDPHSLFHRYHPSSEHGQYRHNDYLVRGGYSGGRRSDELIEVIARGLEEYHARTVHGYYHHRGVSNGGIGSKHSSIQSHDQPHFYSRDARPRLPDLEQQTDEEHQLFQDPTRTSNKFSATGPTEKEAAVATGERNSNTSAVEHGHSWTKRRRESSDSLSQAEPSGPSERTFLKRARSSSPSLLTPKSTLTKVSVVDRTLTSGLGSKAVLGGLVRDPGSTVMATGIGSPFGQDPSRKEPNGSVHDYNDEGGFVMEYAYDGQRDPRFRRQDSGMIQDYNNDDRACRYDGRESEQQQQQHHHHHLPSPYRGFSAHRHRERGGTNVEDDEMIKEGESDRYFDLHPDRRPGLDVDGLYLDSYDTRGEDRNGRDQQKYPHVNDIPRDNLRHRHLPTTGQGHNEPSFFPNVDGHVAVSKTEAIAASVLVGDLGSSSRGGSQSAASLKHSSSPLGNGDRHLSGVSQLSFQRQQQQQHEEEQDQHSRQLQQQPLGSIRFNDQHESPPSSHYRQPPHHHHRHEQQQHQLYQHQPHVGDRHFLSDDEEQDAKQALVQVHDQHFSGPLQQQRQQQRHQQQQKPLCLASHPAQANTGPQSYPLPSHRQQTPYQLPQQSHTPQFQQLNRPRQHSSTTSHHSHSLSQSSNSQHVYHQHHSHSFHSIQQHHPTHPQQFPVSNHRKTNSTATITSLPAIYVMNRQVNTVPDLWKEWTQGLGAGQPSIRQLEAEYGPSWRTSSSAANFFSRRLRIINEIQRMVEQEGLTEEEAVWKLEARREQGVSVSVPGSGGGGEEGDGTTMTVAGGGTVQVGMSLHRLSEILRKKQL